MATVSNWCKEYSHYYEVYDEKVKCFKVVNNGNQAYDFPEVIRKRLKHH